MIEISQITPLSQNSSQGEFAATRELTVMDEGKRDGSLFSSVLKTIAIIDDPDAINTDDASDVSLTEIDALIDTKAESEDASLQAELPAEAATLDTLNDQLNHPIQLDQTGSPKSSVVQDGSLIKAKTSKAISELGNNPQEGNNFQIFQNTPPKNQGNDSSLSPHYNQSTSNHKDFAPRPNTMNQQATEPGKFIPPQSPEVAQGQQNRPLDLSDTQRQTPLYQTNSHPTHEQYRNTKPNEVHHEQNAPRQPIETARVPTTLIENSPKTRSLDSLSSIVSFQESNGVDPRTMQYASDASQRAEITLQATDRVNPKLQVQNEKWQALTKNVGDFDQKTGPEPIQKIEPSARLSGSSALPQTSNTPTQNQPEARFIAQQLGFHLSSQKEKTTTIRLTPEDLGHVRMTLRTNDTGLNLAIFAERPETAEFMRRNIEILAQEFQSLGFENMNFQFDGDAPDENTNAKIDAVINDEGDAVEKQNPSRTQTFVMDGRLDIRI